MNRPTLEQYRTIAKRNFEDEGTIEFDDIPAVSKSENGCYIQAWVYVSDDMIDG